MKPTALAGIVVAFALVGGARAAESGTVAGRVVVNPLVVTLVLTTTQVDAGTRFGAAATVRNEGNAAVPNVSLTLRADPLLTAFPSAPWSFSAVAGGGTGAGAWALCAPTAGNYIVLARATGGGFTAQSPARLVTVLPKKKATC